MPVDDIYQLAIRGSFQGQKVITTHTFRQLVADTSLVGDHYPPKDIYESWQNYGRGPWLALMPDHGATPGGYTLDDVRVSQLVPYGHVAGAEYIAPEGVAGARSSVGDVLAPWISGVASVLTGSAGKRYRGRFFVPGIGEADVTGDTLVGGDTYFKALFATYCGPDGLSAFLPDGTVGDWRLCVFSRRLAGYPAPRLKSGAPAPLITPPAAAVDASTDALSVRRDVRTHSLRSRRAR